jgi:hypothetical protein
MYLEEPRPRIGNRGGAISRVKQLALKSLVIVGAVVMLASAFVVSVAFLAIGLVLVLTFGGYLWWRTRDLRRQVRARMEPRPAGQVIEGEVISPADPGADRGNVVPEQRPFRR